MDPSRWQRPVGAPLDPCVQISEVSIKVCHIVRPRHLVHPGGGALLQFEEGEPEGIDGDVVQKRCQSFLWVPGNGFAYAGLRL